MTTARTEPPNTLPSPEEQWVWVRLAYSHAYKLKDHDLPRLQKDLARLQSDLASGLGGVQDLEGRFGILVKDMESFLDEQEEKVTKPLAALQTWRTELQAGWRVGMFLASALGGVLGGVIVGVILFKLTGKP